MQGNQKGFSTVESVLLAVVVGLLIAGGWYVYRVTHKSANPVVTAPSSSTPPQATTGGNNSSQATLSGTVTQSPTSPVATADNTSTVPVADHTVQAQDSQGKVVASAKTDAQGKYTLQISPGSYTLVLVPQIGTGSLKNNTIQVVAGANTLNLVADTGIR